MNHKLINRILGAAAFVISAIVYFMTVQPSVSFWDCGEFIAASYYLQVPHPPGAPLFLLIGRLFMMVPFVENLGLRMNTVSILSSAFTIMFLYFVIVKLINFYRNAKPSNLFEAISCYGAAFVGAMTYAFTDTFWFNAVEAEVYAISTFFVAFITWLMLLWYEKADETGNERILLLIAFIIGLSSGVHLLSVLAILTIILVIYFKKYEVTQKSFIIMGIINVLAFWAVYPGIIKYFPKLLAAVGGNNITMKLFIIVAFIAILIYGIYWAKQNSHPIAFLGITSLFLIFMGYTSYTMVIIRSNAYPPMNENEPDTINEFVYYINREQYGDFPIFKRRYSQEPHQQGIYTNYSSDMDFMWRYQIDHMFNRYLYWNFIGREGDVQDAKSMWFGKPNDSFVGDESKFPNRYYGIPLLLGLFGLYYHFRRDWKLAASILSLFLLMGILTALYQNQQQPQPRERDYFYVGAFFMYAIWIGIAVSGLIELAKEKLKSENLSKIFAFGIVGIALVVVPLNMAIQNWDDHDRSDNWIPWDFSYNILQSCEPNSILFTNGDNDTFPLWYLQDVEGVRRDIRIVNLSLANTDWYVKQAKNEMPYGAEKVPISFSDEQISRLQPIQFNPQNISVPVSKEVAEKFGVKDTSVLQTGKMTFLMRHTIESGEIKAIRIQDIVVRNIIETNAKNGWTRPIHFAVTCSDDSRIGLDDYSTMQGLTYLITPAKQKGRFENINVNIMNASLFNEPADYNTSYQPGFKFRGLREGIIYLDENQRRMMMNYRNSFLRLAVYHIYDANDHAKAVDVLDKMEEVIPRSFVPIDYRVLSDIGSLYKQAGRTDRFIDISKDVEEQALKSLEANPSDIGSYYNPYRILLEIYDARGDYEKSKGELLKSRDEYQKGLDLLSRLQAYAPGDPTLTEEMNRLKAKMTDQNQTRDTTK